MKTTFTILMCLFLFPCRGLSQDHIVLAWRSDLSAETRAYLKAQARKYKKKHGAKHNPLKNARQATRTGNTWNIAPDWTAYWPGLTTNKLTTVINAANDMEPGPAIKVMGAFTDSISELMQAYNMQWIE